MKLEEIHLGDQVIDQNGDAGVVIKINQEIITVCYPFPIGFIERHYSTLTKKKD